MCVCVGELELKTGKHLQFSCLYVEMLKIVYCKIIMCTHNAQVTVLTLLFMIVTAQNNT